MECYRLQVEAGVAPVPIGRQQTVADLVLAFLDFAQRHYRKDGAETSELGLYRTILSVLNDLYGERLIREFRPLDFKAVRQVFVSRGLSRRTVNGYARRLRRIFRWGVGEELVPAEVLARIAAVEPLAKGRTSAPDHPRVQPVSRELFEQTVAALPERKRTLAQLHWLLGCRAGEIVRLQACDLDRSREPWLWRPRHKMEHRERERIIAVGPQARALLLPLLPPAEAPTAHVFRSRGRGASAGRGPGHLTTSAYRKAITRACDRLGLPRWTPRQVRHARLTEIRQQFGLEAAQAVAGHGDLETTQIYAERLEALARQVVEQTG